MSAWVAHAGGVPGLPEARGRRLEERARPEAAKDWPQLTALLGTWIKGLGPSNVVWGTDSVFHGSPQWQIEALRRLEIPEDMRKKHGFAPLGPANGPVKNQILGLNSARLYNLNLRADYRPFTEDTFARIKEEYRTAGTLDSLRDNTACGYIARRSA